MEGLKDNIDITKLPEPKACSCRECRRACETRPCWPTPAEADRIIKLGLGHRLMLDWWEPGPRLSSPTGGRVWLLCPAEVGRENGAARELSFLDILYSGRPEWRCTFLSPEGLCQLHGKAKPVEGRLSTCQEGANVRGLHYLVAKTWNTDEGRAVVAAWQGAKEERP